MRRLILNRPLDGFWDVVELTFELVILIKDTNLVCKYSSPMIIAEIHIPPIKHKKAVIHFDQPIDSFV